MTNPTRSAPGGKKRPANQQTTGQRKSAANKPGSAATKPGETAAKPSQPTSTAAGRASAPAAGKAAAGSRPAGARTQANRAQSRKIVNRRQTPWGLISVTALIVVLAIGVIGYAVHAGISNKASSDPNKIKGIVHKVFTSGDHETTVIKYTDSPPFGGPHSPIWADCTGTVYPNQIANENAVHTLEHGAIWITYRPGLPADQLDVLTKLVSGQQYMLLTPYEGLKSNISLQAWGYQLFVDSAHDKRIKTFIKDLRLSQKNTPELGASCTNADFKTKPSTPGHPTVS